VTTSQPPSKREPSVRGKFAGGALESASHILGSASAGVFVAGLVGPYIAALDSARGMPPRTILAVAVIALAFSITAGIGAVVLRGLGHCASHDPLTPQRPRGRPSPPDEGAR
jgi:hypothetical protein